MVNSGINFSTDKSLLSQIAVSAFASGSTVILGLWNGKQLIEVKSLDINDHQAISSALDGLNVKEIDLVYDDDVYAHCDFDSFNPLKFEKYFSEEILYWKEDSASSAYEKLKQQKVFTLSYITKELNLIATELHDKTNIHHISTAMGNYSLDKEDNILVMVGEIKMSLIIHKGGFKEFLHYDLENAYNSLYYILLAAHNHNLDIQTVPVYIGGNIDLSSPLYQTLKAHIYNLTFSSSDNYSSLNSDCPIHYYLPLKIARACA